MADQFDQAEYGPEPPASEVKAVQAVARKSPSLLDAPATYFLLGVNILVYALMVWRAHVAGFPFAASFDGQLLVDFGGCYGPAVFEGHQWWRVITGAFVHANFFHIALNMWCLWNLGLLGEPLLGRQGLIATYLLTGIAGNLASLALHQDQLVVGASGAVFGIAGILIVLLSNKKLSLPWKELRALRRSVVQFAFLNLLIGLAPGLLLPMIPGTEVSRVAAPLTHIDNSAHLGGLFCGLAMGLPLFPRMMSGRAGYRARQRVTFIAATLVVLLVAYGLAAAFRAE